MKFVWVNTIFWKHQRRGKVGSGGGGDNLKLHQDHESGNTNVTENTGGPKSRMGSTAITCWGVNTSFGIRTVVDRVFVIVITNEG